MSVTSTVPLVLVTTVPSSSSQVTVQLYRPAVSGAYWIDVTS